MRLKMELLAKNLLKMGERITCTMAKNLTVSMGLHTGSMSVKNWYTANKLHAKTKIFVSTKEYVSNFQSWKLKTALGVSEKKSNIEPR